MSDLATILEAINQQIDGEKFARLINYHPDKIQISGTTLKCFCPVHQELAFRSLHISLTAHTYKCTMKHCTAFKGGSFVDYWSSTRNISPVEAALELNEKLGLKIDTQTLKRLGTNYRDAAEKALFEGEPALARKSVDEALALDPRSTELRLLSAKINEASNHIDRATQERLAVVDIFVEEDELAAADKLLAQIIDAGELTIATLGRMVDIARGMDDAARLAASLLQLADLCESNSDLPEALKALEEALAHSTPTADDLERLAAMQLKAGAREDLLATLLRLEALHAAADDQDALLENLRRQVKLDPENLDVRERIAALLAETGHNAEARRERLAIAEVHAAAGRFDAATALLDAMLALEPQDIELLEIQARIMLKGRDREGAANVYRRLATLARGVGADTRVDYFLEQACTIHPDDLNLRLERAEWKLTCGEVEGALTEFFALAERSFELKSSDFGIQVLERVAALYPTDMDKRLRIGRCLERHAQEAAAFESYCSLIEHLGANQRNDAALAICDEASRLRPLDPRTLDLRIETHLALNQKAEAIEFCRAVATRLNAQGRAADAEATLQRAIKLDRTETRARQDLAELYEATARPDQASALWLEMALFHRAAGRHEAANEAIRESLRLNPANRDAKSMLAEGLEATGRHEEALAIWKELGLALAGDDHSSGEALKLLRHALELAPADRSLLGTVARMSFSVDGPEAALPAFEQWLAALEGDSEPEVSLAALRAAVQSYPDRAPWRLRLAELLAQTGDEDGAVENFEHLLKALKKNQKEAGRRAALYERLVALRPERLELRLEFARLLAQLDRRAEAVEMLRSLGERHLAQADIETALERFNEALVIDPKHADLLSQTAELSERAGLETEAAELYERLAELYRNQSNRSMSLPVLEKLLVYHPQRGDLRRELAEIYEHEGDIDRAVEHNFRLAQTLAHAAGDDAEVITLCRKIKGIAPEFIPARELMIDGWIAQGFTADAKHELDALGDLALNDGQLDRAEGYFKRVQDIDPEDIGSGERLGKLYEARGRTEDAALAFERVLEIYERMSEQARAITILQKLKQLRPEDIDIRGRLARTLLTASNDRREAGQEWLELIAFALLREEHEAARVSIEEARPFFRQDWAWRMQLMDVLAAQQGVFDLEQAWSDLAADAMDAREIELARDAATQGLAHFSESIALREQRIEANRRLSNYEAAADDLCELALRCETEERHAAAQSYLMQALELQPRSVSLLEMLGENQISQGQIDAAFATINRLIEQHRFENDFEQAITRTNRLLELRPDDVELRDFLATLLTEAGRRAEATVILRAIADSLADAGQVDSAQARYAQLVDLVPGDIDVMRRHADLTYEKGGMHEALSLYDRLMDAILARGEAGSIEAEFRRILDMEPGHLLMKERLASFLNDRGRGDEARATLLEIVAAYRDEREDLAEAVRVLRVLKSLDTENLEVREQEADLLERMDKPEEAAKVWRQIAATYRRNGDLQRAAATLARSAQIDAGGAPLQIETAELYEKLGDIEQATAYFLRAIEIHDREENIDKCVPILERAIFLNPLRHDLSDALARIHERLGQIEEAIEVWLSLGDHHESQAERPAAVAIYTHLRTLDPREQEGRRRLARLHEAAGDAAQALEELRELAVIAKLNADAEQETRYLQRILSLAPEDQPTLLALAEAWAAVGDDHQLFETLSKLERSYTAQSRWPEALEMLDRLKAMRPDEPELVLRSIELLIKTGRGAQAAQQGIELIQLYFNRHDDDRALDTLRRIAEIEPGNIERRIALARLLHANGREDGAQQEFFLLASRLSGDEDWAGCLEVCEAGVAIFADDVRLRDLMGRTLHKLGRQAEAIGVQLQLAALYDERGDSPRAQRMYETILADQPDHRGTLEAMVEWALRHEKFPLAIENLVRLAESHYLSGHLVRAIDAMERIQTLDPSRMDLKARLAEIYFEAGDAVGARSTWLAAARGFVQRNEAESAIAIYERIVQTNADDIETMGALCQAYAAAGRPADQLRVALSLADIHRAAHNPEDALVLLEMLAGQHPEEIGVWNRLAEIHVARKEPALAARSYRRLFEIHRGARRLDQARQCLEYALLQQPQDAEALEAMGDVCLGLGRRAEGLDYLARAAAALHSVGLEPYACELCQRILKLDPVNLPVRRLHAEALEAAGQSAAAVEEYIQAARGYAEAHENPAAIEILARILESEPARLDERELYAKLLQREGDLDASVEQYMLILEALGEEEDPRRTIKYCRQILGDRPEHPGAHLHLSRVYERTDKPRQAFKEYEWLADYHLASGGRQEAERFIQKGLKLFPEELAMRTRLIDVQIEMGNTSEAALNLAELALRAEARADTKTTLWALRKACAIEPDNLEHRTPLADAQERSGDHEAARATRIDIIAALLGKTRILEARELADRVVDSIKEDEALRLRIAEMFESAGVPEVSVYHYHHLARRALERGEFEGARKLCRHVLDLKARHVGARDTLIEALLALRDNAAACEEYGLLYDIYDEAGEHDAAHRTLKALIDLVPTRPEPRRKLIALYRKLHRQEDMVDQLRRLAEIYVNENNHDGAVGCLRELIDERPDDTHARVRYIDLYSQIGEETDLWDDYMHLARILARKGQVVEATRTYEKMILLNPTQSICRDEFVSFLFNQGQIHRAVDETRELVRVYCTEQKYTEAGKAIERALNYAPEEMELRERLADIYLKNNRRGLALETYRALARVHEQAGDETRLIQVLEKVLEIDSMAVEFRKRLADLYLKHQMPNEACAQFQTLADQYMERGLFDLAETELRSVLELKPEDLALWERVIEIHLRIGHASEIIPDLMMVAELYNVSGRLKDSVKVYRQILDCDPDNIDILTRYIDSFMQIGLEQNLIDDYLHLADLRVSRGEMSEAIKIYKHLMEIAPDNPIVSERLTATQQMFRSRKSSINPADSVVRSGTGTQARRAPLADPSQSKVVGKVIRNYENVLKLNPNNVAARVKLAELLEKAGDQKEADLHWSEAAECFLTRGDLDRCIDICSNFLERHPEDPKMRERYSKALVQRDSLRAIDGALADELKDF